MILWAAAFVWKIGKTMVKEDDRFEKPQPAGKNQANPELSLVALAQPEQSGKSKEKAIKDYPAFSVQLGQFGEVATVSYDFVNHNKDKVVNRPDKTYSAEESNLELQENRLFRLLKLPVGSVFPDQAGVKKNMNDRGLSSSELAHCYHHVSRLLEDTDNQMLGEMERQRLAFDILRLVAQPGQVTQGDSPTCLTANVQHRALVRDPAAAVKVVVDVATTGRTMLASGQQIVLDDLSIKRDRDARSWPPNDWHRSYTSQLFQLAAINSYWQSAKEVIEYGTHDLFGQSVTGMFPERVARGSLRYVQDPDLGDHLVKTAKDKATLVPLSEIGSGQEGAGEIPLAAVSSLYANLLGSTKSDFVLSHKEHGRGKTLLEYDTESELHDLLTKMQNEKNMPLMGSIKIGSELIKDAKPIVATGRERHAISIASYDPETRRVQIENSWEKYFDREADLSTLYESMLPRRRRRK
jgi:hypothetical protein